MNTKPDKQQDEKGLSLRLLLAGVLASLAAPAHAGEAADANVLPQLPDGIDSAGTGDADVFIA